MWVTQFGHTKGTAKEIAMVGRFFLKLSKGKKNSKNTK